MKPVYTTTSISNSTTSARIFEKDYHTTIENKENVCPYCHSLNFVGVNTNRGKKLMEKYNIIPFTEKQTISDYIREDIPKFIVFTIINIIINAICPPIIAAILIFILACSAGLECL